ncbi:MAG: ornithine cyclodeaminase family protein [Verrucomicrobiales bacterium]|nr:ornithine cyclodeaminase family protein [Verrucomicrobiota bacterium JB025]
MQIIERDQVETSLLYPQFIDQLDNAFAGEYHMPPRQVLPLAPGVSHDALAMLPAWNDQVIALKTFTYFPGNEAPFDSLYSKILVFDRANGSPLALIDGTAVTYWRTAGVSALASRYLSREDSEELLIVGTGNLAPYLLRAHSSVRRFSRLRLWGRNPQRAHRIAAALAGELTVEVVEDLPRACASADVIVAATGSPDPLIEGARIKPGSHVDCLGNHHADHRECDSAMVTRARVFVDTRVNCFKEAGELLLPVGEGCFELDQVCGELAELCRGEVAGRQSRDEITFFKSVGCALGDMAGALAVLEESPA